MADIFSAFGAFALAWSPVAMRVTNAEYNVNLADLGQQDKIAIDSRYENLFDNEQETRSVTRTITRDNPYGHDLLPLADTKEFVIWLRVHRDVETDITRRTLLSLYFEFCDGDFEPLSSASLLRQIKHAGVVTRRLTPKKIDGKFVSPTVYRLQPIKQKRGA